MKSNAFSRRTWLKGCSASLAGAATVACPAFVTFPVQGAAAPNNQFTMGFIGTGNNGTNWLRGFLPDKRVRVLAVCDVNKEGAGYWGGSTRGREPARQLVNKQYKDDSCKSTENFRDIIDDDAIDGIYIGTPDHWHAIMAIAAAKAGKDIYGQKPLSLSIGEGRAMSDAVKKAGIVWQTGSQQRSDKNFRRACELVLNGRIGQLKTIRVGLPGGIPDYGKVAAKTAPEPVPAGLNYDLWLGPAPEAFYCPARIGVNFRWHLDYSGGQLTDWGAHHIDIALWGMNACETGPVAIRNAQGSFAKHAIYNTATDYKFEAVFKNGVTMTISNKERGGVTFEGTEGTVWCNRGRHDANPKSILESKIKDDEIHLYRSDHHIRNFLDCVFSRKPTVAPIEAAHRAVSIAHLGNLAMILRRDIEWDPDKEKIVGDPGANFLVTRAYRGPWTL